MDKEKFFSGLWIIAGLILGSLFTNFIYQDYLAYGGQVQYLVFHNQKLYSASMSLFFYILFKRVKQYAMIYLAGYLLKPWIFLYGLFLVLLSLFPQFILYGMSLILLIKRNFQEEKKEEMLYETSSSFLLRYSILFEIIFMILGCILESFVNPSIMSGMLKLWK